MTSKKKATFTKSDISRVIVSLCPLFTNNHVTLVGSASTFYDPNARGFRKECSDLDVAIKVSDINLRNLYKYAIALGKVKVRSEADEKNALALTEDITSFINELLPINIPSITGGYSYAYGVSNTAFINRNFTKYGAVQFRFKHKFLDPTSDSIQEIPICLMFYSDEWFTVRMEDGEDVKYNNIIHQMNNITHNVCIDNQFYIKALQVEGYMRYKFEYALHSVRQKDIDDVTHLLKLNQESQQMMSF